MTPTKTDKTTKSAKAKKTDTSVDPAIAEMQAELDALRKEIAQWKARYEKGEVRDIAYTNSAKEVAPLYSALDLEGSAGTAFERGFFVDRLLGMCAPCSRIGYDMATRGYATTGGT